jgi:PAS domain S-box-containing protein
MDTDLRVVHMNPYFARLSGRPFEELIGESVVDLFPDSIAQHLLPQLRHVAQTGMAWPGLQFRQLSHGLVDREYTWIASTHPARRNGQVTGLITVLQDVTALAERQRESESINDRLAEAQHVAQLGSWEWDILDDSVWWSRELFGIVGMPPTFTPTYSGFFEHVHPTDQPRLRQQIENTLRDDKPYQLTHRIVRGDGSERVVFTIARLERTSSGQPARLVGTCQDITKFDPRR